MTVQEFHESGLLYHVNETVLWPLGLALAVTRDTESGAYDEERGLIVVQNDPPEVIQDPSSAIRARANVWLAERYRTVKP